MYLVTCKSRLSDNVLHFELGQLIISLPSDLHLYEKGTYSHGMTLCELRPYLDTKRTVSLAKPVNLR